MPAYPYWCPHCCEENDVFKSMSEAGSDELCRVCGTVMQRLYTTPLVSVSKSDYYHVGLGKWIGSKRDLDNGISELRSGKTYSDPFTGERRHHEGIDAVELGNEKFTLKSPTRKEYGCPC